MILNLILVSALTNSYSDDIESIKARSGCFKVSYEFYDNNTPSSNLTADAMEWVAFEEIENNKFSLQRIVIGEDPDASIQGDSTEIAKHWREEWEYEAPVVWNYQSGMRWKREDQKVEEGSWVYRDYQLDESLRYESSGQWNGGVFQTSVDAPLPRREIKTNPRPDGKAYDLLHRFMSLRADQSGSQEFYANQKIRLSTERELISMESGLIHYQRIEHPLCENAEAYWNSQKDFWKLVQKAWGAELEGKDSYHLKSYRLIGSFMQIGEEIASNPNTSLELAEIGAMIRQVVE
ncbi:MAG: hypothetical protein COV44_00075 [Deltaproteobacteria bacterium CG11_big_fil_rev_8_21_14_0_20_45_16]|nr:MAG: hypothetical protein COV44_00075 [Deltaproteobacteria bacterium CG11_big_fil_rev_8_21_14_0_20_45_16]